MSTTRILEVRKGILKKNDLLAAELRKRYEAADVRVINLVSSPGTGKTALLENTLNKMVERGISPAVLVGDLATDNDAQRLARTGVPVRQISTQGRCHLDAEMISQHLEGWDLDTIDILFIENIGNLVCPSSYDLGEQLRAVLLSVTEGEDKPLKYPGIFNTADLAVLTKMDIAVACDFDHELATANIHEVRPELPVLHTSAKKGDGLDALVDYLIDAVRPVAVAATGTGG
ncbi:MAG: hydrogenase nickel incorporation protein HypB [Acidobacteriota bacterium]